MSTDASVEVKGLRQALSTISTMSERARDIRPTRDRVRSIYLRSNERHLSSPGWPPLAPSTLERKQRQGLPSRPVYATGALHRSLTEQKAKGQKNRAAKSKLTFGSSLWYALFATGTKHQPARPQIDLSTSERQQMAKILSRYVSHDELL